MKHLDIYEDNDDNGWIVTYADLVTLLLVFFILLFSVSTIKEESFEETIDSVKTALKGTGKGSNQGAGSGSKDDKDSTKTETGTVPTDSFDPSTQTGDKQQAPSEEEKPLITTPFALLPVQQAPPQPEIRKEEGQKKKDIARVTSEVTQLLKNTASENDARISANKDDRIVINIRGDVFFNPGSAQFKREAMPIMDGIGNIVRKNDAFNLAIGGHTDNSPISTNRYPSNWELSAIRATTVLRYFVRGGMSPDRVTATGYGESTPIAANDTEQHRADNRRIEFVLERK
ncbi:MAG: chemotaxis protein MotB [Oceanospirillaceae bacterium]|jgi:chemotaxis protein MotB